ncbi:MAG: glycine cleavage system protein GcvH [Pseudomonadota bacterium]
MAAEYYSEDHLFIRVDGDIATVGLSDHAIALWGEIEFVELPDKGDEAVRGDDIAVAETADTSNDIVAPLSGEITATNKKIADSMDLINSDPQGSGWLFRIRLNDEGELSELLDADAYEALVGDEE